MRSSDNLEEIIEIASIYRSLDTINSLREAIEKGQWIRLSTPNKEPTELCGGELDNILRKHLEMALIEIDEYISGISIDGVYK